MNRKKFKWMSLRLIFLLINVPSALTGGLLGFLFAPLITYYFFTDWRFWKYFRFFIPMALNFCRVSYLQLTSPAYRGMSKLPLTTPPYTSPDQTIVQIRTDWTTGAQDCNSCQRCCTIIQCPLLEKSSGRCLSYNSFFWRYFNCGRYPATQPQIDYYGCPKWEMAKPQS